LVPVETAFGGVLQVPFSQFLGVMVGVHLLIGLCEGAITFAVIAYLRRVRPLVLGIDSETAPATVAGAGRHVVVASLLGTALLLAGVVSWCASTWPDGLDWSCDEYRYDASNKTIRNASSTVAAVDRWQKRWTPLTEYGRRETPLGEEPAESAFPMQTDAAVSGPASSETAASAWPNPDGWRSLAGILGTLATLGVLCAAARWMRKPAELAEVQAR
jgi:cobalt/nickel transport system permease protein